ncbi:integrating conjugative element protein, PFL_4704 family [Escherichia coli]|uniref:Integrating conjugative element protein, PFL_4704 family n=1 Tax=Escherichia coli TaxID=562 RepID=A0A376KJ17_ECOLX|nr:integrating conjugative element protein, PFL_4704 family [Escherichia coli]
MMMSLSVLSLTAQADELMKWERIPLNIPLKVGQERVIFADKNVRVGFPPALNGKLRVQSTGGAVYLKADSAFPQDPGSAAGCGKRGNDSCWMSLRGKREPRSPCVSCMTET